MPVTAALDAGPGLKVVLAHYAPGEGCKPHRHGGAQVSLVLAGGYREDSDAGEVVVDGAALSAKPAGFEHENLFGETGALILAVNLPQAAGRCCPPSTPTRPAAHMPPSNACSTGTAW